MTEDKEEFDLPETEIPKHNIQAMKTGVAHSSYIVGFVSGFLPLKLSDETIENIILAKMNAEFQLESLSLTLASNERIAQIYSEIGVSQFSELDE